MSYHVNASSNDGAMSVPTLTLEQALAKAEEFKAKGYMGVIIVDAGTGEPLRGHVPAAMKAGSIAVEAPPVSPAERQYLVARDE